MNLFNITSDLRSGITSGLTSGLNSGLNLLKKMPYYPEFQAKMKYSMIDVTLAALGIGFEEVSKRSTELQNEIADWNEGRKFSLGVLHTGPNITLQKAGDNIRFIGKGIIAPDVSFLFKNYDSALLVLTAQMGAHQAAAESRVLVNGNNSYAMELNRALSIVETYIFPSIILNSIFKDPKQLNFNQLMTKGKIYSSLVPSMVRRMVSDYFI